MVPTRPLVPRHALHRFTATSRHPSPLSPALASTTVNGLDLCEPTKLPPPRLAKWPTSMVLLLLAPWTEVTKSAAVAWEKAWARAGETRFVMFCCPFEQRDAPRNATPRNATQRHATQRNEHNKAASQTLQRPNGANARFPAPRGPRKSPSNESQTPGATGLMLWGVVTNCFFHMQKTLPAPRTQKNKHVTRVD